MSHPSFLKLLDFPAQVGSGEDDRERWALGSKFLCEANTAEQLAACSSVCEQDAGLVRLMVASNRHDYKRVWGATLSKFRKTPKAVTPQDPPLPNCRFNTAGHHRVIVEALKLQDRDC